MSRRVQMSSRSYYPNAVDPRGICSTSGHKGFGPSRTTRSDSSKAYANRRRAILSRAKYGVGVR